MFCDICSEIYSAICVDIGSDIHSDIFSEHRFVGMKSLLIIPTNVWASGPTFRPDLSHKISGEEKKGYPKKTLVKGKK